MRRMDTTRTGLLLRRGEYVAVLHPAQDQSILIVLRDFVLEVLLSQVVQVVLDTVPEHLGHLVRLGADDGVQTVVGSHPAHVTGLDDAGGTNLPGLDGDVPPRKLSYD